MFLLINSLLCQKDRFSHSHSCSYILLASCIPCYPANNIFKTSHCSKGTLSNIKHRCIPFGFSVLFITITLDSLIFISIPQALHVLHNLSASAFSFSCLPPITHHQ